MFNIILNISILVFGRNVYFNIYGFFVVVRLYILKCIFLLDVKMFVFKVVLSMCYFF